MANIIKNLVEDESENDSISLQPITQKKNIYTSNNSSQFFVTICGCNTEVFECNEKS